jgi:N-acetylneuraminate synthase
MQRRVKIGNRFVGEGEPVYITGEIELKHNGDVAIAKKLIDAAVLAGCDAVKFQKGTPELCVPEEQKNIQRETPWGVMSYPWWCALCGSKGARIEALKSPL